MPRQRSSNTWRHVRQDLDDLRNGRLLLANRHIDANDISPFLIDDCVESKGSLSGLAVPNDEFALAAANGNHGVNRFQSGLHRLFDRLSINNSWSNPLDGIKLVCRNGPFPSMGRPRALTTRPMVHRQRARQ